MKQYRLTLVFCLCSIIAIAQDREFTQFYASPLTLNPALTGAFDGKYRVGAIYRDQWSGVLDKPYSTFSFGSDLRFSPFPRSQQKDKLGVGLLFFRDIINGIDFNTTQIAISTAYHKSLDLFNTQYLSLGFQFGVNQRNINYEKVTFQDQFNGIDGFDRVSAEKLPENNFSYGDMSLGLNYVYAPKGQFSIFAGLAIHHFTQPNVSFYTRPDIAPSTLFAKYSAQLSFQIPIAEGLMILPRFLVASQGPHLEANVGTNFRFVIDRTYGTAMHIGGWVRPVKNLEGYGVDAAVLMAGLEYNNILFGLSYDLNLPTLTGYKRYQNTFEVSIVYLGDFENDEIVCPAF
jgi:type IX secretion system PorP/SprF family membrane protein